MDGPTIIWTKTALAQRNSIFEYWNTRNKSTRYSKKLNLAIRKRLNYLKSHSKIGKTSIIEDVRVINMDHYSIFYKIDLKVIYIVSFWDNRQDPEKLLKALKNNQ